MVESHVEIDFILEKGQQKHVVKGILRRILAPLTFERILRKLPVHDRAMILNKNQLVFKVNIQQGREKATRTMIKRGDIAYQSLGDQMVIFLDDMDKIYSDVNVIGKLKDLKDIEIIKNFKFGVKIKVKRAEIK